MLALQSWPVRCRTCPPLQGDMLLSLLLHACAAACTLVRPVTQCAAGSLPPQVGPDELRANMLAELVTQVGCKATGWTCISSAQSLHVLQVAGCRCTACPCTRLRDVA